jgi:hypothetical protein
MRAKVILQSRAIVVLVASVVASSSLSSQAVSSPSPFASVTGTAVDSLHGGYLRDAIVRVDGTQRASGTDSLGRFRIDSVPPGSHQLELIHPLLDTLGMAVKTQPITFKAGATALAALATPSPTTVVATKCTPAERNVGPAAAIGVVLDADADTPVAGARVSLDWIDIEQVGKNFVRSPKKRVATVQSDGSFRICGLPGDFSANATAYRDKDSTSVVGVAFSPTLAIVTLFLPSASAPGVNGTVAAATLKGRIIGPDGGPIPRARVAIENETKVALTDENGAFILGGLRAGTRDVTVRALGFQPTETVVALRSGSPREVELRMQKYVPVLNTVTIAAVRNAALDRVGFSERKSAASGKFFSPDDIDKRNPDKLNFLLENVSGLRTVRTADGKYYITGRAGGCVQYFVDGMPWGFSAGRESDWQLSPDQFISGGELGAVEVYDPLSTPAEFIRQAGNGQTCTTVLIWTKSKLRL